MSSILDMPTDKEALQKKIQTLQEQLHQSHLQIEKQQETIRVQTDVIEQLKRQQRESKYLSPSSVPIHLHTDSPLRVKPGLNTSKNEVEQFLRHVAYGEQNEAEEMLLKNPALVRARGSVQDLSKKAFQQITGFQYAVWALDWRMWTMLLKYLDQLDEAEAAEQWHEWKAAQNEQQELPYGMHASWQDLIHALDQYMQYYDEQDWGEREQSWCQLVGNAQAHLPAHVVNEYCDATGCFSLSVHRMSNPLLRNRRAEEGDWFTAVYREKGLGHTFAWIWADGKVRLGTWKETPEEKATQTFRSSRLLCDSIKPASIEFQMRGSRHPVYCWAALNKKSLEKLKKIRESQVDELVSRLEQRFNSTALRKLTVMEIIQNREIGH